jgi:hypothetical protein
MGTKRGRGKGAFIDSVLDLVDAFYGDVMQHLKAWSAAPPRMRETEPEPVQPPALSSTSLSSQDGAEPAPDPPPVLAGDGSNGQAEKAPTEPLTQSRYER